MNEESDDLINDGTDNKIIDDHWANEAKRRLLEPRFRCNIHKAETL